MCKLNKIKDMLSEEKYQSNDYTHKMIETPYKIFICNACLQTNNTTTDYYIKINTLLIEIDQMHNNISIQIYNFKSNEEKFINDLKKITNDMIFKSTGFIHQPTCKCIKCSERFSNNTVTFNTLKKTIKYFNKTHELCDYKYAQDNQSEIMDIVINELKRNIINIPDGRIILLAYVFERLCNKLWSNICNILKVTKHEMNYVKQMLINIDAISYITNYCEQLDIK